MDKNKIFLFSAFSAIVIFTVPQTRKTVKTGYQYSVEPVLVRIKATSATRPTLDALIYAIGRAEGWGLSRDMKTLIRWNSKTVAPFGLLGDYQKDPRLGADAVYTYSFMVKKLTNPSYSTYVQGLVKADKTIDTTKLLQLRNKYAPLAAQNDPQGLNDHWLKNVKAYLA